MRVPRSIFRQYDIRGLVGERADRRDFAHALGRAFAAFGLGAARPGAGPRRRARQPSLGRGARRGAPRRASAAAGGHRGGRRRAADAGALLRACTTSALDGGVPGHRLAQSAGVQRLQDGARRRVGARRRHPAPLRDASSLEQWRSGAGAGVGRRLGARRGTGTRSSRRHQLARPVRVVVDCGNGVGQPHRRRDASRARRRGRPALLRVRRHLPQPPSRPDGAREPAWTCRRRSGGPAPSSASPSTATRDRIGAVDETGRDDLRRPAAGALRPRRRPPLRPAARRSSST